MTQLTHGTGTVAVVGGGAAGMMAALQAASCGAAVLLFLYKDNCKVEFDQ